MRHRGCPRNCKRVFPTIGHWSDRSGKAVGDVEPVSQETCRRPAEFQPAAGGAAKESTMNTVSVSTTQTSVSERVKAVAAALIVGIALVYTTGFAASTNVHNAAHDTRHGLAFPCH